MQASEMNDKSQTWQTIGHEWAVGLLQRAVANQRVGHTYLFAGPEGVGKTHLALRLAAMLNCTGAPRPCGACSSCTKTANGTHPDVSVVRPSGNTIKISQMREVQHALSLSPFEGRWRVIIVTEFDKATPEAANALLKTLEEPPSRAILLLTATDASLLLPTVVSRCQAISLRAVSTSTIEQALLQRWDVEPDRATLLAKLSAGRPGWAISAATNSALMETRHQAIELLTQVLAHGQAQRVMLAQDLASRDDIAQLLSLWQIWWRDIALLCSGNEGLICNLDFPETLERQAGALELGSAHHVLQGIQAAQKQLEQNVNSRLVLEVLLLDWPHLEAA